jgi:hypothetical protein
LNLGGDEGGYVLLRKSGGSAPWRAPRGGAGQGEMQGERLQGGATLSEEAMGKGEQGGVRGGAWDSNGGGVQYRGREVRGCRATMHKETGWGRGRAQGGTAQQGPVAALGLLVPHEQ